ncbi:unnamed protein product [Brassica oleracea]
MSWSHVCVAWPDEESMYRFGLTCSVLHCLWRHVGSAKSVLCRESFGLIARRPPPLVFRSRCMSLPSKSFGAIFGCVFV